MKNNFTKSISLLITIFLMMSFTSAQSIFVDDFESYTAGTTTGGQNPWWTTWSGILGGAEDGIVSADQAASGTNSMLIAEGSAQDVLLLLGNQTSGIYGLRWKTYVPAGATAYYNIQESETPGVAWNMELRYNQGGTQPGTGNTTLSATTFSYPEDAWFDVEHFIDLDNDMMTLTIDGYEVETYPYAGNLGSIDFFSVDGLNRYYIDDVVFEDLSNPSVNVTFHVNMNNETIAPDGASIAGEMNVWAAEPMTDNLNGIFTKTFTLPVGDTIKYKFQNGLDVWENEIPFQCDLEGFGYRFVIVEPMDMDLDLVCFNECADCSTSIEDLAFENAISIYPNPANELTNVVYNLDHSTDLIVQLSNNLGQQISFVLLRRAQNGNYQVNLRNLATGIYYLRITNGEYSKLKKLFVE